VFSLVFNTFHYSDDADETLNYKLKFLIKLKVKHNFRIRCIYADHF